MNDLTKEEAELIDQMIIDILKNPLLRKAILNYYKAMAGKK